MKGSVSLSLARRHLRHDPVMCKLVEVHKLTELSLSDNIFADLVEAIVNQQLSEKAGAKIFRKFKALFRQTRFPSPKRILETPDDTVRTSGISYSKIRYIKGIAEAILRKKFDMKKLYALDDDGVITELTKLRGVGQWTAQMILMFSLGRPDVFSMGDLGLRTAISRLYTIDRDDTKRITKLALTWKPYRTIACRYLWKSLDRQ